MVFVEFSLLLHDVQSVTAFLYIDGHWLLLSFDNLSFATAAPIRTIHLSPCNQALYCIISFATQTIRIVLAALFRHVDDDSISTFTLAADGQP